MVVLDVVGRVLGETRQVRQRFSQIQKAVHLQTPYTKEPWRCESKTCVL